MTAHHQDAADHTAPTTDVAARTVGRVARASIGLAGVALLIGAAAGCGSDIGQESAAVAEESSAEVDPTVAALEALDAPTRNLVTFEATWQCDLTRFAFGDLEEMAEMRSARQAEVDITPEAYEAFLERLDTEPELAALVAELSGDCAGGEGGESGGPVAL